MATSFKLKAVAELRAAKKIEREQEATAQAEYEEKKAAKLLANEQRIASKLARTSQPEQHQLQLLRKLLKRLLKKSQSQKLKRSQKLL